jgi:hypothetical protein
MELHSKRRLVFKLYHYPKVFPFEQTRLSSTRQIFRLNTIIRRGKMTMPNNYKDYARYAEHCLKIVAAITDQESRRIQREMAAEWFKLANMFSATEQPAE